MLSVETLEKISQQLQETTGLCDWFISGAKIHARCSTLYQAHHPRFAGMIAIKRYHNRIKIKQDYQSFWALSERMNKPGAIYRVPVLYGYLDDVQIILMEWVAAPTLKQQLWLHFYQRNFQQKRMRQTFSWLRHFHEQRNCCYAPTNLAVYREAWHTLVHNHPVVFALLQEKDPVFCRALDSFQAGCEHWEGFETLHTHIHSDFTPTNILLNNKQVVGIDFWSERFAPVADDLARMLTHIAMGYPNMITKGDMATGEAYTQWPLLKLLIDAYQYDCLTNSVEQRQFFLLMWQYQLLRRRLMVAAQLQADSAVTKRPNKPKMRLMQQWSARKARMMLGQVTQLLER